MPDTSKRLRQLRWFAIAAVVLVVLLGGYLGLQKAQAAPPQPFPYNHAIHLENGIQCIYCHSGAVKGKSAGIPSVGKCQGCHANMAANTDALSAWNEYLRETPQVTWVPVAIQPDFVYFSHQPHINAGVNCEQCHGDVSQMTVPVAQPGQNMGWCLTCHQQMAPEKFEKLSDCATCHK